MESVENVGLISGQYIRNTFNAAKDSMSINGMDSKEMEAELAKAQEGEGRRRARQGMRKQCSV